MSKDTTSTTKKQKTEPTKPDWIVKESKSLSGKYLVIYQESSVDNEPILYTYDGSMVQKMVEQQRAPEQGNDNDDVIDEYTQQPKMEFTFHETDQSQASIVSADKKKVFCPVGQLSNRKLLCENDHWLLEFEYRPAKGAYAIEPGLKDVFESYAYCESNDYQYDLANPDENYIEFTIDGAVSEGRHHWEFLDEQCLKALPPTCLRAHLHVVSRFFEFEDMDERTFESYILCRPEDADAVQSAIQQSLKRTWSVLCDD